MKEKLKAMYQSGSIDMNGLLKAVERGWVTMEDVIEIVGEDNSLAVIKAAKIAEISKSCNAIIVAGIDLELTQGEVHFNLSIEDQANIANLFRVVELGGTEFPYQSDGGVCRIYTAAEIAQIYIAAQTLITTQTTYHNALKAYVQSLEGSEEISAVTYGMTLPEPYLSEMNAKLAVAQAQMNAISKCLLSARPSCCSQRSGNSIACITLSSKSSQHLFIIKGELRILLCTVSNFLTNATTGCINNDDFAIQKDGVFCCPVCARVSLLSDSCIIFSHTVPAAILPAAYSLPRFVTGTAPSP